MDFKALRDKILPNIEMYNNEEVKIVVAKLLEFLIDIDNKNNILTKENQSLADKIHDLSDNKNINDVPTQDFQALKTTIMEETRIKAQKEYDQIIQSALDKINNIIDSVKRKDEENKKYRKHIVSIFRKSIFRFSDTSYYIVKADDPEFQELIQFVNVDEKLQKLCDANMESLKQDENYQQILQAVKVGNNEEDEEPPLVIEPETKEADVEAEESIDFDSVREITLDEIEQELTNDSPQTHAKFIDVLNQYKNK
jgi:ATP-dependent Lon protease